MSLSGVPPSDASPQDGRILRNGERVQAEILSKVGDSYSIRIRGTAYQAKISGDIPPSGQFRAEVLKTSPLELRIIPDMKADSITLSGKGSFGVNSVVNVVVVKSENGFHMLKVGGLDFSAKFPSQLPENFNARVLSNDPLTISFEKLSIFQRSDIKSGLLQLVSDPQAVSRIGERLPLPDAQALRQLINNSGLFFENKLSTGKNVESDNKYAALTQGDTQRYENITRMQLASILLEDGLFLFFESDELEGEAVVRVKKEEHGYGLNMRLKFSRLGETVIGINPSLPGYSVSVRTEADISDELSRLDIKGAVIRWAKLAKCDIEQFDMKKEILARIGRFEIIA